MKRAVVQKDGMGCGAACVAFLKNISYDQAIRLFNQGSKKANLTGFSCREIVSALERVGLRGHYHYANKRRKPLFYNRGSIVLLKRSRRYPRNHYLCRYKNLWMDPWINLSRNSNMHQARAGFRKRLPGKPIYVILTDSETRL